MPQSTPELRLLYKRYYAESARIFAERRRIESLPRDVVITHTKRGKLVINCAPAPKLPELPRFPDELRGLQCGAKTRAGTPCKITALYGAGRCKFHGGLSSGPKTKAGKRRSAQNGFKKGWRKQSP